MACWAAQTPSEVFWKVLYPTQQAGLGKTCTDERCLFVAITCTNGKRANNVQTNWTQDSALECAQPINLN